MNTTDLAQISQLLDKKFDEKLAPIKQTLESHGRMLESQGKILSSHGEMLGSQGEILKSHGKMLESQGQMLESQGQMLESQGKILSSHSKMLKSLKKDQDAMLDMLNKEQMTQRKRLKRIEDRLDLPSTL